MTGPLPLLPSQHYTRALEEYLSAGTSGAHDGNRSTKVGAGEGGLRAQAVLAALDLVHGRKRCAFGQGSWCARRICPAGVVRAPKYQFQRTGCAS